MPLSPRQVICAFLLLAAGAPTCRRATPKQTESEPPIPVVVEPVQIGNIRGVVTATAVVEALPAAAFVAIAPESGRIVEISNKVGDTVKAGDVLVRFEFPALRAEGAARAASAKSADLRLQNAKVMQARVHKLLDLGAASQREADEADAEVTNAEADIAQTRAAQIVTEVLSQRTTIRAPFNGVVAERLHNPGDLVGTATDDVILRVIDPRQVEVVTSVPVRQAARFAVGASARGVTETKSTPEILRVVSRADPQPGATAVPVRLAFVESTELTPGTQLGVEIDAEQRSNVPLVPAIAVVKDGNELAVFVATGNQARRRLVVPGLEDAVRMEIRSGVKAGDMVITQGQSNLRDGSAITISQ
jgi:membrane fusion protein (multidrug efflux system)